MTIPDPVTQTEAQLLARFAGPQPESLLMRDMVRTMFSNGGGLTVSSFMETVLDDTSAAAARTTLGAEALGVVAGINTQTASYTLVLGDVGKVVEMDVAGANDLTVPPNASVAFAVGTRVDITQIGAGQTTVVAGSGVTIRQRETKLNLAGQYAGASLYKRGTNEWVLFGDLAA